jgi:hypothetical protein
VERFDDLFAESDPQTGSSKHREGRRESARRPSARRTAAGPTGCHGRRGLPPHTSTSPPGARPRSEQRGLRVGVVGERLGGAFGYPGSTVRGARRSDARSFGSVRLSPWRSRSTRILGRIPATEPGGDTRLLATDAQPTRTAPQGGAPAPRQASPATLPALKRRRLRGRVERPDDPGSIL